MGNRRAAGCLCVAAGLATMLAVGPGASAAPAVEPAAVPVPAPIYGVTLDCGYRPGVDGAPGLRQLYRKLPEILSSLRHLAKKPTVRVVFDEYASPAEYIPALIRLRSVAYVMGELLDSSHLADFDTPAYRARAVSYFDTLRGLVDIWEIGNEVNGSWTGQPDTVAANVGAAFDEARRRGLTTALTLYRDTTEPAPNQLFTWVAQHLPARVEHGVNYALVSYYQAPNATRWTPFFRHLASVFPQADVGFGEMGGTDVHRNRLLAIQGLYGLQVPAVSSYVGGYFYWYYCVDAIPYQTSDTWALITRKIAAGPPERLAREQQPPALAR